MAKGLGACFALLAMATLLLAQPVAACGGFFAMGRSMAPSAERIALFQRGDEVEAHFQIRHEAASQNFAWLLPCPSKPQVSLGSEAMFDLLEDSTRPQFQLKITNLGDCVESASEALDGAALRSGTFAGGAPNALRVLARQSLGPYETAILQGHSAGALKAWLRRHAYAIPPQLDAGLAPYLAKSSYFVAIRFQAARGPGDQQPMVLRYRAKELSIPLRLSTATQSAQHSLHVWLFGPARAHPTTHRQVVLDEQAIDWLHQGRNYQQVVAQSVQAAGGNAFVTDCAGPSQVVPLQPLVGMRAKLSALRHATEPVAFLEALQRSGCFLPSSPTLMSFVRRHVRLQLQPRMSEHAAYAFPRLYQKHFVGQVNTTKAVAELLERVVLPAESAARSLRAAQVLTRMSTSLTGTPALQDPEFAFDARLPLVPVVREATAWRDCRQEKAAEKAPIIITLANGRRFTVRQKPKP